MTTTLIVIMCKIAILNGCEFKLIHEFFDLYNYVIFVIPFIYLFASLCRKMMRQISNDNYDYTNYL